MTQRETVLLDGELYLDLQMDGELETDLQMDGEIGIITKVVEHDLPVYTGDTQITPSDEEQVLNTADRVVTREHGLAVLTLNPIQQSILRPSKLSVL